MYNPDFWEVCLDQTDLEDFSNEAGIWKNLQDRSDLSILQIFPMKPAFGSKPKKTFATAVNVIFALAA